MTKGVLPWQTGKLQDVAMWLRHYRALAGLTQEQFAERANVSVHTISNIERGAPHQPRLDTLLLIIQALHLPPGVQANLFGSAARQPQSRGSLTNAAKLPPLPVAHSTRSSDFESAIRDQLATLWHYRMYIPVVAAHVRSDDDLHTMFLARRHQGLTELVALLHDYAHAKMINVASHPIDAELSEVIWTLEKFWLPYMDLSRRTLSPASLDFGATLLLGVHGSAAFDE